MAKIVKRKPRSMVFKTQNGGFFKKIWRGIKKAANWVNNTAKKTKIASTLLPLIPHPAAKVAGAIAKQAGYGKKRKGKRIRVVRKRKKVIKPAQLGGNRSRALTGRMYLS